VPSSACRRGGGRSASRRPGGPPRPPTTRERRRSGARTVRDLELGCSIMRGRTARTACRHTRRLRRGQARDARPAAGRLVHRLRYRPRGPRGRPHRPGGRRCAAGRRGARPRGRHPRPHRDNPLALFNLQHVMELKPAMAEATAGHEDERFTMSNAMLATPDASIEDYVAAEQGFERIRDRPRRVLHPVRRAAAAGPADPRARARHDRARHRRADRRRQPHPDLHGAAQHHRHAGPVHAVRRQLRLPPHRWTVWQPPVVSP
jgi:hypothetical protein